MLRSFSKFGQCQLVINQDIKASKEKTVNYFKKNIFFFIILGQETGANPYGESRERKSKFRGI